MVYSEAFQEAFNRLERKTNVQECKDFRQMLLVAKSYFGDKWYPTFRQEQALKDESQRRGYFSKKRYLEQPRISSRSQVSSPKTWRRETVTVRGKSQIRHRDLRTGRFIKKTKI